MMAVCRPDTVPRNALMWVNRRETGSQMADTMRKYCTVWVKLLRYIWRTSSWGKRPSYELTAYQEQQLVVVKGLASRDQSRLRKKPRRVRTRICDAFQLFPIKR